jgi:DNA-directed RNA polymerase subunit RPC12/RpoP
MSEFKFSCPHCDRHIQCDDRYSGKQIQCPACNHLIVVPLAAGHNTVQSGRTWDTFLPGNRVEAPKDKQPPEK